MIGLHVEGLEELLVESLGTAWAIIDSTLGLVLITVTIFFVGASLGHSTWSCCLVGGLLGMDAGWMHVVVDRHYLLVYTSLSVLFRRLLPVAD